jgi:hypothetical protein
VSIVNTNILIPYLLIGILTAIMLDIYIKNKSYNLTNINRDIELYYVQVNCNNYIYWASIKNKI